MEKMMFRRKSNSSDGILSLLSQMKPLHIALEGIACLDINARAKAYRAEQKRIAKASSTNRRILKRVRKRTTAYFLDRRIPDTEKWSLAKILTQKQVFGRDYIPRHVTAEYSSKCGAALSMARVSNLDEKMAEAGMGEKDIHRLRVKVILWLADVGCNAQKYAIFD